MATPRRLLALPLLASALVAGSTLGTRGHAATTTPPAMVFGEPVTVDPERLAGEPDLVVAPDGRRYVSAPWGLQTQTAFLWRSEDGGTSYRQVQAAPGVQTPYAYRSGGDTEYQVGPPAAPGRPDRLYVANQDDLVQNTCGFSDDAGRTFTVTNGIVCPQTVGADREWLATTRIDPLTGNDAGHDIDYLWYDHFAVGSNELHRSDDGLSYSTTAATRADAAPVGSLGNPGNDVADPRTGVVYVTAPASGADSAHNGVAVGWSADGGQTLHMVEAVPSTTAEGATGTDFTVVAVDTAGTVYVAYTTQGASGEPWQVWLVHSTGTTLEANGRRSLPVSGAVAGQWSRPVPLTGPGSAHPEITHAVFPWIDAGDPGRVNVAFYGTSMPATYDPNSQKAQWSTDVVQSLDALDAAPASTLARVSPLHTHLDSICFNGVGCTGQGNRNLLDFFEIRHTPAGAAVVVYDDDANSLTALFPGGPVDTVATQVAGASLYNVPDLAGTPLVAASVTDAAGDGYLPTVDTSTPSLDLLGAGVRLSDPSTLQVTLSVADLSAPVTSLPATEGASGVTYLVSWHVADDLWYAAAHVDAAGQWTYDAGRPQSVPFTGTGGPKFAVYTLNADSQSVTGSVRGGTITLTVPTSAVGSPTAADTLHQVTGFSLADRVPHAAVLSDTADATPSFADPLGRSAVAPPGSSSPTPGGSGVPAVAAASPALANTAATGAPVAGVSLLVVAGVAAAAGRHRRRPRGHRPRRPPTSVPGTRGRRRSG